MHQINHSSDPLLKYTDYDIVFREIPGEVTLAINLSNCPHRCPNCHSPQLQTNIGEQLDEKAISRLLEKYGNTITCICFMGGDAAPGEVCRMAEFIRAFTQNRIKTAWYSGCETLNTNNALANFNYIKLGAYIERYGGLNSPDTNQRLYEICNGECINITQKMWK